MKTPPLPIAFVASLALPLVINAGPEDDYSFTITDGEATITGYSGPGGDVVIPLSLEGYPVVAIAGGRSPVFASNETLISVVIPDSVTFIENGTFRGSTNLTGINVDPDNSEFTSISGVLFDTDQTVLHAYPAGKTDSAYEIPDSVASIENQAFAGSKTLANVEIPDSVTVIGSWAFRNCTSLTSVAIPNSVTSIGREAFEGCTSLTSVVIPDSVTSIEIWAFRNCPNLTDIDVHPDSFDFSSLSGVLFDADQTVLLRYPAGRSDSVYEIPNGVTSIGLSAFEDGMNLVDVEIPNSVTSIGNWAFQNCTSLTGVVIPDSVTSIGSSAFSGCTSLTSVVISNSVTSIGHSSFRNCTSLGSVVIPEGVTSIGGQSFQGCTSLASVVIPDTVTFIGVSAFSGCTSLNGVVIPDSVTSIGGSAFRNCTSLTGVVIPDSVTSIGGIAFWGCTSLERAVFRGSAPSMGGGGVFIGTSPAFSVFYFDGSDGFTSPTWEGYPAINLGSSRPFTDWLLEEEILSAKYTGPASDLNGDGVSLLMAYALDLEPTQNLTARTPQATAAADQLRMDFPGDQPGIDYTVEASTNLADWDTAGVNLSEPGAEGQRTATVDFHDEDTLFLRLIVAESF